MSYTLSLAAYEWKHRFQPTFVRQDMRRQLERNFRDTSRQVSLRSHPARQNPRSHYVSYCTQEQNLDRGYHQKCPSNPLFRL